MRVKRQDLLVGAAIGLLTAVITWLLSTRLAFTITHLDVWFDSDSVFVFDQMTNRFSPHNDTNSRHPLFALLVFPPIFLLNKVVGVDRALAALVVLITVSTLSVTGMYAALRLVGRPVGVAVVFTGLFLSSTCGLLFLGIHERLMLGGLSIILCVIAYCLHQRRLLSTTWLTAAAALTLGITITNFLVGAAALLFALGFKKGIGAALKAVAVVVLLSIASRAVFPKASLILDIRAWPLQSIAFSKAEVQTRGGTVLDKASVFYLHSIVFPAPAIQVKPPPWSDKRFLSLQKGSLRRYSATGYAALALWILVLGMGLLYSLNRRSRQASDLFLITALLGQFGFFLVFGTETVLYSPYYVPLVLAVASKTRTDDARDWRPLALSALLLLLLVWNNGQKLFDSIERAGLLP